MRLHTNDLIHRFQARLLTIGDKDAHDWLLPHARYVAVFTFIGSSVVAYLWFWGLSAINLFGIRPFPGTCLLFWTTLPVAGALWIRDKTYVPPAAYPVAACAGFGLWILNSAWNALIVPGWTPASAFYTGPVMGLLLALGFSAIWTGVLIDWIGDRGPAGVIEAWTNEITTLWRHTTTTHQQPRAGTLRPLGDATTHPAINLE